MEKQINFSHISVLLQESIEALNIKPNGVYVDCTLGGAGHSKEIVKQLKLGKLVAIDKDDDALRVSKERLKQYANNVIFVKSDFKNLKTILANQQIGKVDGILADLGISSYQVDTAERGFSYMKDGALDMRMDTSQAFSAYDVVNTYSETDLANVIYEYGEERNSRKIAKEIVTARKNKPIETTLQLSKIVEQAFPKNFYLNGNVAKKTFQAIRIEVNGELQTLKQTVKDMIEVLDKGGRLAIITFHSLEDRIVKNVFRESATDCICPKDVPVCVCNHKASVKLINKKPIVASKEELKHNKRSASAKLRIVEKL